MTKAMAVFSLSLYHRLVICVWSLMFSWCNIFIRNLFELSLSLWIYWNSLLFRTIKPTWKRVWRKVKTTYERWSCQDNNKNSFCFSVYLSSTHVCNVTHNPLHYLCLLTSPFLILMAVSQGKTLTLPHVYINSVYDFHHFVLDEFSVYHLYIKLWSF